MFHLVGDLLKGDLVNLFQSARLLLLIFWQNACQPRCELTLTALIVSCGIAISMVFGRPRQPGSWVDHLCRVVVTAGVPYNLFSPQSF